MMHFMGFDLSSERKYATYGQMSEKENDDRALCSLARAYF